MERNDDGDDVEDEFFDAADDDFKNEAEGGAFKRDDARHHEDDLKKGIEGDALKKLCNECKVTDDMILECQRAISPLQVDRYTIVRFIVGADMSMRDAIRKIIEDVDWRRRVRPHEIRKERVNAIMSSGEVTILPLPDRDGHPVVYLRTRLHKMFPIPHGCNYTDTMIYTIELALTKSNRVSGIADLTSFGLKNMDVALVIQALNVYNNHYPERLGNCIFIGSHFWFQYGFKLVKHLVGPRTLPRIHLVSSMKELEKFVDPRALPEDCALSPNSRVAML